MTSVRKYKIVSDSPINILIHIGGGNRVQIRVFRGPEVHGVAPWGYYVKQPAEDSNNNWNRYYDRY